MNPTIMLLQNLITLVTFLSAFIVLSLNFRFIVNAESMQADNFILELNQVDKNFIPTQVEPPNKMSTQPIINTYGFTSIYLSEDTIDFGTLVPTDPSIRKVTVSIKTEGKYFYIVQNPSKNLQNQSKSIIAPTSCDSGSCTIRSSDLWTNALTFGFGVRCESKPHDLCPEDFDKANYFRPALFESDTSSVLTKNIYNEASTLSLLYKINTASTQQPGIYETNLRYKIESIF